MTALRLNKWPLRGYMPQPVPVLWMWSACMKIYSELEDIFNASKTPGLNASSLWVSARPQYFTP